MNSCCQFSHIVNSDTSFSTSENFACKLGILQYEKQNLLKNRKSSKYAKGSKTQAIVGALATADWFTPATVSASTFAASGFHITARKKKIAAGVSPIAKSFTFVAASVSPAAAGKPQGVATESLKMRFRGF